MPRHIIVGGRPRHIRGWRPDRPDPRDKVAPPAAAAPPPSADLSHVCPPVRDQGQLGSCTANASLEAMGMLYKRAGRGDPMLSRLFTYYYSRKAEGTMPTDDSGCEIRDVVRCLAKLGSCLESTWPYVDDGVTFSHEPPPVASKEAMEHQLLYYIRLPGLWAVKASIAQGYAAVGGFSVPENMESEECAKTGLVKYPAPGEDMLGGHCVLFMGYDDASQTLRFMNSWGTSWGRGGFGYLPYEFMTQGLADDFWTLRREEM